jgi:hypothetical protein
VIDECSLDGHQCALCIAPIEHFSHASPADNDSRRRQGGVKLNRLLTMQHTPPIKATSRILVPREARGTKYRRHGRQGMQSFFIDEAQLAHIERIRTGADA